MVKTAYGDEFDDLKAFVVENFCFDDDNEKDYINVHSKADWCQLNLPHRTRN